MNPKDYFYHKSLCSLPWTGAYIDPCGVVKNCAISAESLGNIHHQTVQQCLLGEPNKIIKQDMLNNVRHPRCNACYKVENFSNKPETSQSNRTWYKRTGVKFVEHGLYDQAENFKLDVLDLRWRNTCNQACVYCGPDLSSRWASELNDTSRVIDETVLEQNKKWLLDNLDTVSHVYLAGGEPLLIKENIELLDRLWNRRKDVTIRVNTNLSRVDTEVFKRLAMFDHVKWTVSVDAIESHYEYIRYPGNWNTFIKNLISLRDTGADINFNLVWFVLNAESIFDCFDFLMDLGFHENAFVTQPLTEPEELGVWNLSDTQLESIKQTIESRLEQADSTYWLYKSLSSMYNCIILHRDKNIVATQSFLETIDLRRNLDHRKIFTNLYN